MHAGRVLAVGAPYGSREGARQFVARGLFRRLSRGGRRHRPLEDRGAAVAEALEAAPDSLAPPKRFNPGRLWAYARRETVELLRDPIRLAFAGLGPIILMLAFGFGISFDIENLKMAAFDQDQTPQSRELLARFRRLALLLGAAADRVGRGGATAPEERPHPDRRRGASRLRARPSQRPQARGRRHRRRRHDVPRRDGQELCPGRHRQAGRGAEARDCPAGAAEQVEQRRYRGALPLQPGVPQRQRDGAERLHADALPDPGDHVGDLGRAREGDRLDRQFPLDADHPLRVPDRQAAALHRHRDDQLLHAAT